MPYHIIPIRREAGSFILDIQTRRGREDWDFKSFEDALNHVEQMGYDVIQIIPPTADIRYVMKWKHMGTWDPDNWIIVARDRQSS
ncbi:MAG: hypothetical protein JW941_00610 [Candidatus Coatesbacteria bacterium]|nr:hypothetical protein [Candidatus Coatesbacteria bacterium]